MNALRVIFITLLTILLCGSFSWAADQAFALKGATVYTAAGPPIANAVVMVRDGKIVAVGTNVPIPSGVQVYDLAGKVVIPGLIDEHSHIGAYNDANEFPQAIGPENRAIDALKFESKSWTEAVNHGVTTVITGPGSGERMGGQSVTIKTWGKDLEKRILKESRELKMAVNARDLSHIPNIRKTFYKALEYKEKWKKYNSGDKKGPPPHKDLAMEAIIPALEGKEKVRCHIHYANDIMTFLKITDEFDLDLTFIHSSESYKVADEIAKRNVSVIYLPLATRIALSEDLMYGLGKLYQAGVKVSLHTDHPVVHQRLQRINAGMAIRYGVPEEAALQMVTINPAVSSKIDDRVDSIAKGKDADLVVLDGTWYEPKTRVTMVFVDGKLAYNRESKKATLEEEEK